MFGLSNALSAPAFTLEDLHALMSEENTAEFKAS
jgi:hypothetical protein